MKKRVCRNAPTRPATGHLQGVRSRNAVQRAHLLAELQRLEKVRNGLTQPLVASALRAEHLTKPPLNCASPHVQHARPGASSVYNMSTQPEFK